jgi:hypothetical protein
MMRARLRPSDLRAEANRLIKAGKMPTLDELRAAIAEAKRNPPSDFDEKALDARLDEDADTLLVRNRKGGQQ